METKISYWKIRTIYYLNWPVTESKIDWLILSSNEDVQNINEVFIDEMVDRPQYLIQNELVDSNKNGTNYKGSIC